MEGDNSSSSPIPEQPQPTVFTRREVLRGAGAGTLALLLGRCLPPAVPVSKETPTQRSAPLPTPELIQSEIISPQEQFEKLGMEDFWDFYVNVRDTEQKYGSKAGADFSKKIYQLCDRVAKGAIAENDPELLRVRDRWGDKQKTSITDAEKHIAQINLQVTSEASDNPEEIRNGPLKKFAQSFAPMSNALPKEIFFQKFGPGVTMEDAMYVKSFRDFDPWVSWLELFHESTHATDIYFERLKPYVDRKKYLEYITTYYKAADIVMTRALQSTSPEEHYTFWSDTQFGALLALPDISQKMNGVFEQLEPVMFGKVSDKSKVGSRIRYANLVWAVGRKLQDVHSKQVNGQTLSTEDDTFLHNEKVSTLMSMALQETLHILVDSREEYSSSGERYVAPEIFTAQKELNNLRIKTFATFPLDKTKDPMAQMKIQLGF